MRRFGIVLLISVFSACSTTKPAKSGIMANECGPTPIMESDLKALGFYPVPGKVVVLRVFATWCPFCKIDLARMGELFRSKAWTADKVNVFLLAYRTHGETRDTVEAFQRDDLAHFGLPESAVQVVYVDEDSQQIREKHNPAGLPLFSGLQGLPFGMVFGKDERLAYRGHFTSSDAEEKRHYDFVNKLEIENCGSK